MTFSIESGPTGLADIERVFQKMLEIREQFGAVESKAADQTGSTDVHQSPTETSFRSALDQAKERQSMDGKAGAAPATAPPAVETPRSSTQSTPIASTGAGPKDGTLEKRLMETLRRELPKSDVPPDLALAVMQAESNFDPRAVSPKGAIGVMQLMPQTAAGLGVDESVDLFEPEVNIPTGLRHLSNLMAKYGGDEEKALAAYNAGSASVDKYKGVPPFPETRSYIQKIYDIRRRLNENTAALEGPES